MYKQNIREDLILALLEGNTFQLTKIVYCLHYTIVIS